MVQIGKVKTRQVLSSEELLTVFEKELKCLLWSEKEESELINKILDKVVITDLQNVLEKHQGLINDQVQNIETVFKMIEKTAAEQKCEAMAGLIKNVKELVNAQKTGASVDLEIISALQKIKHYQIVTYNLLSVIAPTLRFDNAGLVLYQNLENANKLDRLLTIIAEDLIFAETGQ